MEQKRHRMAHRVRAEQPGGPRDGTDVASALDEVDGVDVVGVHDPGAAQPAHDLGKDVQGDHAPGEVAERRHRDRDRGVDVALGDALGDPHAQGGADGESEVDGEVVLLARDGAWCQLRPGVRYASAGKVLTPNAVDATLGSLDSCVWQLTPFPKMTRIMTPKNSAAGSRMDSLVGRMAR